MVGVAVEEIIQLVHLEGLVLESDFELSDSLVVRFNLRVESKLLLVKDRLFGQKIIIVTRVLGFSFLLLNQLNLVLNPLFLHLSDLLVDLLNLLCNAVTLIFERSPILITISASFQISTLPVQSVDAELFLLNLYMTRLDTVLNFLYVSFLLLEFANQFLQLLVKQFILTLRI